MKDLTKKEAQETIDHFFKKDSFTPEQLRKIRNLSMKYRIRLERYRKRFCKKCYSDLRGGKTRISKYYKKVTCKCGAINRWKIH